ncbi:glycosyl transferase family 2 [Candidatus Woesebacteria bacterium]|nr:glycosyl transferase family 2 [Candidatus Woesebacteria bacterium]
MNISIIILNYNTKEFLKKCLQSIKKSHAEGISIEVIVVDNASTESIEDIKGVGIELIKNKKNVGFSKGNNIGLKKARGEYILFLNPDTVLSKDALKTTFKFMQGEKDVGVASPRLELPSGELDEASHRGFPTPWNSFAHFSGIRGLLPKSKLFAGYTQGWLLDDKSPHEVDSVSGAFFFVRRKAGEEVGWWDEDYFWYGDELDFCYRLKEKGWKVMFVPLTKVLHYRGVASGIKSHSRGIATATRETQLRSARASTEAMRTFYKKHYMNKYPRILTWIVLSGIGLLQRFRVAKHS